LQSQDIAALTEQLNAALVDDRRRHGITETDLNLSESSMAMARPQIAKLDAQREVTRQVRRRSRNTWEFAAFG
jgi:hypothetical protein